VGTSKVFPKSAYAKRKLSKLITVLKLYIAMYVYKLFRRVGFIFSKLESRTICSPKLLNFVQLLRLSVMR